MSVTASIRTSVQRIKRGEPFTNTRFLRLGSRAAVDKALSRLVEEGAIHRITRGVFVRPKQSRFAGQVMPDVNRVVEVIAKDHGEMIQLHGAEAARRFKLSTQMPTSPIYYTNGASREIHIGKLKVKLMHTTNQRRLQHSGKKPGMALSALWYLGKENVNPKAIEQIRNGLSSEEFEILCSSKMPAWMNSAIEAYTLGSAAHG